MQAGMDETKEVILKERKRISVCQKVIIEHDYRAGGREFGPVVSESESYLQNSVIDYRSVLLKCHKIYVRLNNFCLLLFCVDC